MWDEYKLKGLGLMTNALKAGMRNTDERTSSSDKMVDVFFWTGTQLRYSSFLSERLFMSIHCFNSTGVFLYFFHLLFCYAAQSKNANPLAKRLRWLNG